MKLNIRISIIAIFCMAITTSCFSQTKAEKVKIQTSAVCGMCKATIEKALNNTEGIKYAELDVASKVATVKYNPEVISEAQIKELITLSGYDADDVIADEEAYEGLHTCCKKDSH